MRVAGDNHDFTALEAVLLLLLLQYRRRERMADFAIIERNENKSFASWILKSQRLRAQRVVGAFCGTFARRVSSQPNRRLGGDVARRKADLQIGGRRQAKKRRGHRG